MRPPVEMADQDGLFRQAARDAGVIFHQFREAEAGQCRVRMPGPQGVRGRVLVGPWWLAKAPVMKSTVWDFPSSMVRSFGFRNTTGLAESGAFS